MAAVVTKVEKEVDEYKEDGLKFTINEHILDDEKDIGYDPHEGNLLRGIDWVLLDLWNKGLQLPFDKL